MINYIGDRKNLRIFLTNYKNYYRISMLFAAMAELADAHGSGPCERKLMEVQVLLAAPNNENPNPSPIGEGFGFLFWRERRIAECGATAPKGCRTRAA